MEYILGKIIEPSKYKTQELAKYKKGEVWAERIIIESIKDHLVPFVANLKTSKAIYDKLVNFYSISTSGQKMSLKNKLYKMKKPKDEDMDSFLMKISQIRDQLQGLWETIFYSEMTIYVLNALPLEWSSFATSIYSKRNSTPFDEFWSQWILEETKIKAKDDIESNEQSWAFIARKKKLKKGKFGKSKKKPNMSKVQCFGCNEYGHFKRDFPNKQNNKRKEEVKLT